MGDTICEYVWPNGFTYAITQAEVDRFLAKVTKHDGGCWEWTGYRTIFGYGQMGVGGKAGRSVSVHRLAHLVWVGPIAPGLTIDHRCHNEDLDCTAGVNCAHRRCVNPAHLEPVTSQENCRRSKSVFAENARKTHCKRGHEFTEENTYLGYAHGGRACRACMRGYAEKKARKRAAEKALAAERDYLACVGEDVQ